MCRTDLRILSLDKDLFEYVGILDTIKNKSVYFLPSYLKSTQIAEHYPIKIIAFFDHGSIALAPYVHRRINDLSMFKSLERDYWDIITPHEYSGVIHNAEESAGKSILLRSFFHALDDYCKHEKIIAEFIRFDPFITEVPLMGKYYEISCVGQNVYINLEQTDKEIWGDFEYSAQKNIRAAIRCGLQFHEAENEKEIDIFIRLYRSSMQRLRASRYYYFNREYFFSLLKDCEGAKLFIVRNHDNTPLAASILLYHGDIAHHHLTGYDPIAMQKRPNDFMIYYLAMWAKKEGMKCLHLGGGAETIRNFKAKFSPLRIPYHIGFKIHDRERYEELCAIWRKEHRGAVNNTYFPLYRAE